MDNPSYEQILKRAQAALEENKKAKAAISRRKFNDFMLNGFWVVLVALILGGAGYYGYTNRAAAVAWINAQVLNTFDLNSTTLSDSQTAPSTGDCENLVVTVTNRDDGTHISLSPVAVGKCYNIGDTDRSSWATLFADSSKIEQYATKIHSESPGASLSQEVIATRIQDSLSSNVLDLR